MSENESLSALIEKCDAKSRKIHATVTPHERACWSIWCDEWDRISEEIRRLEKQRDDLQAANTAEVERRRKAQEENAAMRRELELAASGEYTAESLEWWARKALGALRESTGEKAT